MGEQIAANAHFLSKNYFSNVALPVNLSYFHASEERCEIKIEWSTLNEKNTAHFEIWKSTDGFDYKKLAEIQAAPNGELANSYRFIDRDIQKINFYQLKSKDIDGQIYLYGVRDVNGMKCLEGLNTYFSAAYPNPVLSDELYFDINMNQSNETVLVQLLDNKGSIFYSKASNLMKGLNKMYYKFSAIPKGNYILQIEVSDGTKSTQKISVN
ncbi:MAG: T9SS type A sorting domain-containing protein [Bacteroidetes bacterium]|nr:T9SS type A sorting domain-containing protein [Bacteroidota bacterium]